MIRELHDAAVEMISENSDPGRLREAIASLEEDIRWPFGRLGA